MVPDTPHPRHRERLLKEAAVVHAWMHQLANKVEHLVNQLNDRLRPLQTEIEELETLLKESMG